jgi:hypothetical protein
MNDFIKIGGYIVRVDELLSVELGDNEDGVPQITVNARFECVTVTFASSAKRDAAWDKAVEDLNSVEKLI